MLAPASSGSSVVTRFTPALISRAKAPIQNTFTGREPEVALKPKSLDHVHAPAIPLAALTACANAGRCWRPEPGPKSADPPGAGGVGSSAVQLAKWKGAYVIGTASAHNHEFLRGLGADETIDYNAVRFEDKVHDVDMVLDAMAGETQKRSWKTLKPGGILVSILGLEDPPAGARHAHVFVQPNATQLSEIAKLVDAGKVRAIVETVLPLAEARRAQELNETGHTRGKIVLRVI